jgi:uncharacterized protein
VILGTEAQSANEKSTFRPVACRSSGEPENAEAAAARAGLPPNPVRGILSGMIHPLTAIQSHLAEFRALGARRLGVFGSFARDAARADSDVDVYVEFDDAQRTYDNFFTLHERLEALLDRRVDLVTDKSLTETQARLILPTVRYAASHG